MAQSIRTRYLPPTNYKGARIKAITASGISVTIAWDYDLGIDDNHELALKTLCEKLEWHGLYIYSHLKDGEVIWVNINGVKPLDI
jgi:hypothetical protein